MILSLPPFSLSNKNRKIFFILSLGRSGSLFLSDLLHQAEKISVFHEPNRLDFLAYLQAHDSSDRAKEYIINFRKKFIYNLARKMQVSNYGEVNSILRRHAAILQQEIPNATFIHLVRDGRDVVRSMMARRTFTYKDPITQFIAPKPGEAYFQEWPKMSRFEKLCWYWLYENKILTNHLETFIRFEDLISDYAYFSKNVLDACQIHLPFEIWESEVGRPKNVTEKHTIPHWTEWRNDQMEIFTNICGSLMNTFGYY